MSEQEPNVMEVGRSDMIEIQLDRHKEPREVRVVSVDVGPGKVMVEYPRSSPDKRTMFGDIREEIDISRVNRIIR